jgi:hypothetical protein
MTRLRNTRRGWSLQFCAAPDEKSGANSGPEKKQEETPAKDLRAKLLEALKIDDAAADDETIIAAITAQQLKPADEINTALLKLLKLDASSTPEQVSEAMTKLEERVTGYETSERTAREAEVDAELADLDLSDEARAILREQMMSDPEKARVIVSAIPKKKAAATEEKTPAPGAEEKPTPKKTAGAPPAPKHDANAAAGTMSDADKIKAQNDLIEEIKKEGKFTDFESARAEARRRKSELFA